MVFLAVTGLALLVAACDNGEQPGGGGRVLWDGPEYLHPPDPNPWRVSEFDGWEHCNWEHIRFLWVPPEAVPASEGQPGFFFVRASAGELAWTVGDFDGAATLPLDAVPTEYTEGDRELWFSPDEGSTYAYIVDGETVERWPRFDGGCD